ncbi:MAG: alpha-N-arabinofuranosidase, partial [Novosphingobium sp.]
YVAVANMDPDRSQSIQLSLGGLAARSVSGQVLTHDLMDAHNVPGEKEILAPKPFSGARLVKGVLQLNVPAKSVVVVRLY